MGELEREIAHILGNGFGLRQRQQRAERLAHMGDEPERDAPFRRFPALRRQRFVREDDGSRLQRLFAGRQLGDGVAEPANGAVVGERQRVVDGLGEARRARREFLGQLEFQRFVVESVRLGLFARGRRKTGSRGCWSGPAPARAASRRALRLPASLLPLPSRSPRILVFGRRPAVGGAECDPPERPYAARFFT